MVYLLLRDKNKVIYKTINYRKNHAKTQRIKLQIT